LGLIASQAYKNTLSISIGIISGAVNTIVVLPNAFENSPENWGLLKDYFGLQHNFISGFLALDHTT
jgi:hypothetical protein